MIYLIGQLSIWLLLTAAFAALAGWAFAAERAAGAERALRRDRDNLMRDIIKLASGEGGGANPIETEREADATRRLLEIRDARIAELEQTVEATRARANDAAAEIAELQRRLEQGGDSEELVRLRALVAEQEREADDAIETTATVAPSVDEEALALQSWRLRYFEQRVRYLEGLARAAAAAPAVGPVAPDLPLQWRVRDAEARAAHLEEELRSRVAPPTPAPAAASAGDEAELFAADADIDMLLRWRLLYLERRVAYLQAEQEQAAPVVAPPEPTPDPDRWKWRARYLEARVRRLEQRAAPAEATVAAPAVAQRAADVAPAPAAPPAKRAKPPVLASARNGAPDDFTLIDGVSVLQQSTLYSLGVFHFEQIAAWTAEHVAWVDQYLRLGGRIEEEEWVEQASDLAREGPAAARRVLDSEEI